MITGHDPGIEPAIIQGGGSLFYLTFRGSTNWDDSVGGFEYEATLIGRVEERYQLHNDYRIKLSEITEK